MSVRFYFLIFKFKVIYFVNRLYYRKFDRRWLKIDHIFYKYLVIINLTCFWLGFCIMEDVKECRKLKFESLSSTIGILKVYKRSFATKFR